MIPVLSTRLPTAQQILPYLREIDHSSQYSNQGPLFSRLRARLGRRLGYPAEACLPLSSGTSALMAALLTACIHIGKDPSDLVVALPAWSFPATLQSVLILGMKPLFVDVDESGYVSPEQLAEFISNPQTPKLDVFLVVAPFGRPLDYSAWEQLSLFSGIEIVIDAASAFTSLQPSRLLTVVSTHATKIFSSGEGGILFSSNLGKIQTASAISNFGFSVTRIPECLGGNFKISEYSCAVALASDDIHEQKRIHYQALADAYRHALEAADKPSYIRVLGDSSPTTTFNVVLTGLLADKLPDIQYRLLNLHSIETKQWWPMALSSLTLGRSSIATHLEHPIATQLSSSCLGLPMGEHVSITDVKSIVQSLLYSTRHYI